MADVVMNSKGAEGSAALPFCGCCCCFSACYTEWPACFGCSESGSCLCYHFKSRSCKFPNPDDEDEKDICWLCGRGHSTLAPIKQICSVTIQYFCLDSRLSIPPVDEIPCMITFCFFTLVYKSKNVCQFMKTMGELDAYSVAPTSA